MFWDVCAICSLQKNFLLGLVWCWKITAVVLSVDWSIMWHFTHVQAAVLKQRILQFSGYVWTENQVCCCVHHFLILCCGFSGGKDLCEEWGYLTWAGFVLVWYFIISLMICLRCNWWTVETILFLACVKVAKLFVVFLCVHWRLVCCVFSVMSRRRKEQESKRSWNGIPRRDWFCSLMFWTFICQGLGKRWNFSLDTIVSGWNLRLLLLYTVIFPVHIHMRSMFLGLCNLLVIYIIASGLHGSEMQSWKRLRIHLPSLQNENWPLSCLSALQRFAIEIDFLVITPDLWAVLQNVLVIESAFDFVLSFSRMAASSCRKS